MIAIGSALLLLVAASGTSVADRYDDWQRADHAAIEMEAPARTRRMAEVYEKDFGDLIRPDRLRTMTVDDLRLVYRASASATLLTNDENRFPGATRVFDALEARGATSAFERETQYKLLVDLRHLSAAKLFAEHYPAQMFEKLPGITELPGCCGSSRPDMFAVASRDRLLRLPAPSASIVVVAHPLCHFTQEAIRAIENDAPLAAALEKSWLWIAPQSSTFALDAFEQWNREHPRAKLNIAYRQSEWPMPAIWETPTFYFFKNGLIVATVRGWPADGHLGELRNDAKAVGLDVP